jgi:serine/threonine protein kinase
MTSEDCDNYIGQRIKDYTLLRKLGGGGSAHVYLARNADNDHVAIKLLDTKHLHSSSTYRQNFFQESHILQTLRHDPYILSILDDGEYEGKPYIVTEYAPGGTLRDRFRTSRHIKLNEAFRILVQIGEAISRVHQCNIVHNDLKPENILFNKKNEPLLADFGIAVQLKQNAEWRGSPRGTYTYMAPEQFDGIYTTAGDQYALGCIAYELLTEKHPLEYHVDFNPHNLENMRELHRNAQILSVRQLSSNIPEHIDQAVMQTLAKRPSMRHASVASFIRLLYPSTSAPPDSDFHLAPILNTPPPNLSDFEASHVDIPPTFALQIEAREIAQPIKENNVQIPSDARHSSPSIIKSQYNDYTQNTQYSSIPQICPYREGDGTTRPKRKISEVLYDLRLPLEYVNQLVSPLGRLSLDIVGGELENQYGGRSRKCTLVKNSAGHSRPFLFIPDSILIKANDETKSAIDYLRNWFPKGSILTLFHNKTPVLEIRRIMQKQWKAEQEIAVIFVPEQDLRSLARMDEGEKRYWLIQDLQLQDLIDHQWKPLSLQHMDQNDIHILVQIIMKIPQVIEHSGRGWRLLLNEAGLEVISGEELESQGPAYHIAWNLIMRLKVRARLPERPECEVLGWLLLHICRLFSISSEDQREIQRIMKKYTLIPPGWVR